MNPASEPTSKPLVSIVIPSWNRGYCIEQCIRDAQAQTWTDIEIIVVDDASSDDTRARVLRIDEPRLQYVAHERNQGGGAARNTGICHARGDYIAFLDSDDRWLPQKLEHQMRGLLEKGEDYGFSYTWLQCVDAQGRETMRIDPEYEGDCRRQILVANFVGTFSNVVIRRDLLALVGGLDEQMRSCQDWDLFIRMMRLTQVHCLREYVVHYLQSSGDDVRISLNPRSVVQGHRRILYKFAADYAALPRAYRAAAHRVYFNAYVGVGALGEALKAGGRMLLERSPGEPSLPRGVARAAKKALRRVWAKSRLRWFSRMPAQGAAR